MKIAFIGLGAMGFPMARHLAKQHDLLVWNRTREKAERHAREHGTTLANDLADCVNAEVIITMLPTSVEVDGIVDKLLPSVHPGTLWIDATSGDPKATPFSTRRAAVWWKRAWPSSTPPSPERRSAPRTPHSRS